jgi:hypothetical protein
MNVYKIVSAGISYVLNITVRPCSLVRASSGGRIRADSHIPNRSHAVPLRVYIVSFPIDLHSAAVFDSHMSCRSPAANLP